MSSPGHWEVVSKSKKAKQNGHTSSKLSKIEKKKFAENAPKVEDILPLAQVKSLYTDEVVGDTQESKKPKEKEVKSKEDFKKAQKKQSDKKKDAKEKSAKYSLELDEGQLLAFISEAQSCYSENPLAWLRDLASYITKRLAPANPQSVLPNQRYLLEQKWPSVLLPPKVLKAVEVTLMEEPLTSQSAYFSSCLTSMANEMSKGHSAVGQQMILHMHVKMNPQVVAMNMDRLTAIRNSYQNRPPICLALLDVMGYAGCKDISVGLKVWSEVMFPLIEMRHYSCWVVSYLAKLISLHSDMVKSPGCEQLVCSSLQLHDLHRYLVQKILPVGNSLPSQVQKDLLPYLEQFRAYAMEQSVEEESKDFFTLYLMRLSHSSPKILQNELLQGLMQCLSLHPGCFALWQELYENCLPQSVILLQHISLSPQKSKLSREPLLQTMEHFISVNTLLMDYGEEKVKTSCASFSWRDLEDSAHLIDECLQKAKSPPQLKGFPYIRGSLLCILGMAGLIIYDTRKHGGIFRESNIGHFMSDAGALPIVECVAAGVQHFSGLAYEWVHANVPFCCHSVVQVMGPPLVNSIEAFSHLMLCLSKYLMELCPVIVNWIDGQLPGFSDKCIVYLTSAWNVFQEYSWMALEYCWEYSTWALQWTKDNVLVGKLSPENIQKLSWEAYNVTQNYAGLTVDWLIGKIN